MFEQTVSIDLGASYTKVAVRNFCFPQAGRTQGENAKVLMLDGSALIPSLVVKTGNQKSEWVFGKEAAGITPGKSTEVFRNWKATLFQEKNDAKLIEAATVAGKFFGWLRDQVVRNGIDVAHSEVRIAMPEFSDIEAKASAIARCMELNGWTSPKILKVTEPRANVLGLFCEGRNVVAQNQSGTFLLHYNKMFGQNIYIRVSKNALFFQSNPLLHTLVVDIGAFTTDIAAVTFDTRSEHDGFSDIRAESYALGVIDQLDAPLFASVGSRHGFDWNELTFAEAESAKRAIYAGQTHPLLLNNPSRLITIGGDADRDLLQEAFKTFVDAIWEKVCAFTRDQAPGVVYLTGGGSLIAPVGEVIKQRLKDRNVGCGVTNEFETADGNSHWREWRATGESLARVATAVGGASVILQAAAEERGRHRAEPIRLPQPEAAYKACECQGGNKDCCRCGGRGFYRRTTGVV